MKSPLQPKLPIFIISGTPAAGKSTVAHALMQHFELGLHISVDNIREWVVSGIARPVPAATSENDRQLRLARWSALQVATIYAEAGFAVALDDVLQEPIFQRQYQQLLHGYTIYKVLLSPSPDVILERNALRPTKPFEAATLAETVRPLHAELQKSNHSRAGWLVVDSSDLSVAETVNVILQGTMGDVATRKR